MLGRYWFTGIALLLVGCSRGPAIESMVFLPTPAAALAVDAPVRIYRNSLPRCEFEEVGLIRTWGGGLDRQAEALRKRARQMGGAAIVGLTQAEQSSPGRAEVTTTVPDSGRVVSVASFHVDRVNVLSGTVFRFLDPGCRA